MALDFVPKKVVDPRLDIQEKRDWPIYQSGSDITPQNFSAQSISTNNAVYSIQIPSLENAIDMTFLVKSTVSVAVSGIPSVGERLIAIDSLKAGATTYSEGTCSLGAFPFHQLITTANCVINSCSFASDLQNTLPSMLYMVGRDQLDQYNHMCPTQLDNVQDYSHPGYVGSPASVFNSWPQNTGYKSEPRGAWVLDGMTGDNSVGDGSTVKSVVLTYTSTEPLLLSPFVWGKSPSIMSVQNITINLNFDSQAKRYLKFAFPLGGGRQRQISLSNVQSAVQVIFLSPKASMLANMGPRNVVPFYKLDRYISVPQTVQPTGGKINSPSIQLSSIPKAFIATIRSTTANTTSPCNTNTTPAWFLPVVAANLQWNSSAGILSSSSVNQLYKMSTETGVQQSFAEWSGVAQGPFLDGSANVLASRINTVGPVFAAQFGPHVPIQQEYLSNSSLGSFNFQLELTYPPTAYTGEIELCVLFLNEGVVSTSRSNTQAYVNIVSKEVCMSVIADKPVYDGKTSSIMDSVSEILEGSGRSGGRMGMGKSAGKSKLHKRIV